MLRLFRRPNTNNGASSSLSSTVDHHHNKKQQNQNRNMTSSSHQQTTITEGRDDEQLQQNSNNSNHYSNHDDDDDDDDIDSNDYHYETEEHTQHNRHNQDNNDNDEEEIGIDIVPMSSSNRKKHRQQQKQQQQQGTTVRFSSTNGNSNKQQHDNSSNNGSSSGNSNNRYVSSTELVIDHSKNSIIPSQSSPPQSPSTTSSPYIHPIEMKARTRKRLNHTGCINVQYNDQHMYDDGDQKPIVSIEKQLQVYDVFANGCDYDLLLQEHDWGYLSNNTSKNGKFYHPIALNLGGLSEFAIHCIAGHYKIVYDMINIHTMKNGKSLNTLIQLLEKRETSLRLSPLLLIIASATKINEKHGYDTIGTSSNMCKLPSLTTSTKSKLNDDHEQQHEYGNHHHDNYQSHATTNNNNSNDNNYNTTMNQWEINQLKVIKILLEYGARPDAKDVLGRTVVHYGAGIDATYMTLEAVSMCIAAAKSSFMFGKEIELRHMGSISTSQMNNSNNKQQLKTNDMIKLNGKRGIAQGYIVDTGCRIVYLFGHKTDIRYIKPSQIKLTEKIHGKKPPKLCNIPDRMGRVPLIELYENSINHYNNCSSCHDITTPSLTSLHNNIKNHQHCSTNNNNERLDVVEFLLFQHNASIDVPVGWGIGDTTSSIDNNNNHDNTKPTTDHVGALMRLIGSNDDTSTKNDSKKNPSYQNNRTILLNEHVIQRHQQLQQQQQQHQLNAGGILLNNHHHNNKKNRNNNNTSHNHNNNAITKLIYNVAVQKLKQDQKIKRNHCSQCHKVGTIQEPLRICEPCMSVRFCSDECQLLHWKAGHMYECKHLSRERNMFVLVKQSAVIPNTIGGGSIVISSTTTTRRKGSFHKPKHVGFFHPFTVKILYLEEDGIVWIYDKTRECEFYICLDYCDEEEYTTPPNQFEGQNNNSHNNNRYYFEDLIDKIQTVTAGSKNINSNKSNEMDWTSFSNDNSTTGGGDFNHVPPFKDTTTTTSAGTGVKVVKAGKFIYVNAVFENLSSCKLYFNQTKMKAW